MWVEKMIFLVHTTQCQKEKLYTMWVGNALPSAQPDAWKKVVLDVGRKKKALPNARYPMPKKKFAQCE